MCVYLRVCARLCMCLCVRVGVCARAYVYTMCVVHCCLLLLLFFFLFFVYFKVFLSTTIIICNNIREMDPHPSGSPKGKRDKIKQVNKFQLQL